MLLCKRSLAAALCVMMLTGCVSAMAVPLCESAVPRLTVSSAVRTEDGVLVSGERATVDFDLMQTIGIPCVGWLYQEETRLSGPILQNSKKVQYLKRTLYGNLMNGEGNFCIAYPAVNGIDARCIRVMGYAAQEGPAVTLVNYERQDYYERYPSARLLTPDGDWQIDWFCYIGGRQEVPDLEQNDSAENWLKALTLLNDLEPLPSALPRADERVLLIRGSGRVFTLIGTLRPITYDTERDVCLHKCDLDAHDTLTRQMDIRGVGSFRYYAQNDNLWQTMRYESVKSSRYREFGFGACGPTSAAMVIANLVDDADLPRMRGYNRDPLGTLICECSVNRYFCNERHVPYQLRTAEEYARYLPLAIADFAAGNNRWGIISRKPRTEGTGMGFLRSLCVNVYGLGYREAQRDGLRACVDTIHGHEGDILCLCVATATSPFTRGSHYVVVVGSDDTYFYILDPQWRSEYVYNTKKVLEIVEPGVVRIRVSDCLRAGLVPVALVERAGGTVLSSLGEPEAADSQPDGSELTDPDMTVPETVALQVAEPEAADSASDGSEPTEQGMTLPKTSVLKVVEPETADAEIIESEVTDSEITGSEGEDLP